MLQQFTWGQFLVAVGLLSLLWYGMVLLVFFRAELFSLLGGRGFGTGDGHRGAGTAPALPGNGPREMDGERGDGLAEGPAAGGEDLMGPTRLPEGVTVESSGSLRFSVQEDQDREDQVGLVADVVQDLKLLFAELESSGGGKAEFLRRAAILGEEYGGLSGHPSLGAIHGFIRERALFPISDAELQELW